MVVTRIIRNSEGLYLKRGGAWKAHFTEAQRFGDAMSAISATMELRQLQRVDLVIVMGDKPSPSDIVLPLWDSEVPTQSETN